MHVQLGSIYLSSLAVHLLLSVNRDLCCNLTSFCITVCTCAQSSSAMT